MKILETKIRIKYISIYILIQTIIIILFELIISYQIKKNEIPYAEIMLLIIFSIYLYKFFNKEIYRKLVNEYLKYYKSKGFIEIKKAQFFENYTIGYIDIFKNEVKINIKIQNHNTLIKIENIISIENNEKFSKNRKIMI